MFGMPAETTWVWVGLAIGSAVMLGVVLGIPTAPPDADRAATAIEDVAVSEHGGEAAVDLSAQAVRLGPERIGLRGPGGRSHAPIQYGPITPVPPNSSLAYLLDGHSPKSVFVNPGRFGAAMHQARSQPPKWRPAGETLRIKHVHYGEVSGVLVAA